jgi:HPt (histidine-containing phosphotransfer) domain-containing protein
MAQTLTPSGSAHYIDRRAVERWHPFLHLYFESMEAGIAELRSLAQQFGETSKPELLRMLHLRCHGLKGASETVGFKGLASLLRRLERQLEKDLVVPGRISAGELIKQIETIASVYRASREMFGKPSAEEETNASGQDPRSR